MTYGHVRPNGRGDAFNRNKKFLLRKINTKYKKKSKSDLKLTFYRTNSIFLLYKCERRDFMQFNAILPPNENYYLYNFQMASINWITLL